MAVDNNSRRRAGDPGVVVVPAAAGTVNGSKTDPTTNVIALIQSVSLRHDDMRMLEAKRVDSELRHLTELGALRDQNAKTMAGAEAQRLDSIRQVDREDVTKTAAQALSAIQTLATATTNTAETLRTQVATSAAALANQLTIITGEINKRISALELSSSEGKGKQQIADPMMEQMVSEMRKLSAMSTMTAGKSEGISTTWVAIGGVIAAFGALVMIGVVVVGLVLFLAKPGRDNSPIYVPAPPGTVLPSTPPQNPPR